MTIAIVGLGYVGLPLALQFARNGVTVVGLDVDPAKVSAVNDGRSYIKHIEAAAIAEQVSGGRLRASSDFSLVGEVEAVIICVPTPLNKYREPDISYVLDDRPVDRPTSQKGHCSSCSSRRPIRARPTPICGRCSKQDRG